MNVTDQQVILLHGLGRSPRSMQKIEKALTLQGYRVLNIGYSRNAKNVEQIITQLLEKITPWIDVSLPVNFVGHSFGGIIIRGILAKNFDWNFGRCVMLGSPNKGSGIASYMVSHNILKYFTPEVTKELTLESELIRNLPEPSIETGIIAGSKNYSPIVPVSWFYKTATGDVPGDGVVELSNTPCSTMSDFIVLPLHHSFMMWDSQLIEQIIHFLQNAHFVHPEKSNLKKAMESK